MSTKKRLDHLPSVRFLSSLVETLGVHGSAFVHLVYSWIPIKAKQCDCEPWEFSFYTTWAEVAAALGVDEKQARRIGAACSEHITVRRGFNRIWLKMRDERAYHAVNKLYTRKKDTYESETTSEIYYYWRKEAQVLGVLPSIIYSAIRYYTLEPSEKCHGYYGSWMSLQRKFPWATKEALRGALGRLRRAGFVMWDDVGAYGGGHRHMITQRPLWPGQDTAFLPEEPADNLVLVSFERKKARATG